MLHIRAATIDDALGQILPRLISRQDTHEVLTRKGASTEIIGASIEISNPRCRVSRSLGRSPIFSALGEFFWYMQATTDISFIRHYIPTYDDFSDDGGVTASGAYGPRLFQATETRSNWDSVIELLRKNPHTRNAVVQIFSNNDRFVYGNDIPCTCTLQFFIRDEILIMHTHMRSNDIIRGFPHDVFAFTMLQEIAARQLGVEVGCYIHSVGSSHLYSDTEKFASRTKAETYIREGHFEAIPMPQMPNSDPWADIKKALVLVDQLHCKSFDENVYDSLPVYWRDIVTLLAVYHYSSGAEVDTEKAGQMISLTIDKSYTLYALDRLSLKIGHKETQVSLRKEK